MSRPHLILASASPRRRELLAALGIDFDVAVPEVEELTQGASPGEVVLENARRKARAVAADADAIVLAVDTDVALDGRLLGKASDEAGARGRLEALSARTHEVLSAIVALNRAGAAERTTLERTKVRFAQLPGPLIDGYISSGEWRDRAGAYAVQGLGSMLIERVEGDLSNVIGLPVRAVLRILGEIAENPNSDLYP